MSLIHQALKKVERENTSEQSAKKISVLKNSNQAPPKRGKRLWILIAVNLIAIGYLIWSWYGSGFSFLFDGSKPDPEALRPRPETKASVTENTASQVDPAITKLTTEAVNHYHAGRWRDARDRLEELILQDPLNPEHYNNLGLVLKKLGRWEDSLEQYRKALQLDARYAPAHNNLGVLHLSRGDHETAQHYLDTATQLQADYLDPYLNLGFLYEMRGDFARAKLSYQTFLAKLTTPEDPIRLDVQRRIEWIETQPGDH